MTGKLIVLDGTDGSGKTTQTELLKTKLESEGFSVEVISFPQYNKSCGKVVKQYLDGEFGKAKEVGSYRASILYAVDRYEASSQLRSWLDEGEIVIANRYVFSSMGHQAGKIANLSERDKFIAWLDDLEYNIFGVPKPDLNLLLFAPFEIGKELARKRAIKKGETSQDIHEVDDSHLREASEAYQYVAKKFNFPVIKCAPKGVMLSPEEIAKIVWEVVEGIL